MKSKLYGNKQDETLESLPIAQGGTSARTKETAAKNLGFVSHDQVKKPDGVIILGEDGYIRKEDLPPDVINAELATLFAPTEVDLNASADIFITNYSSDVTYNVTVTGGTYVRENDKITFTAGTTITTGTVTVNGRSVSFYVGPPKPVTPSIVSPSGAALNNVGPSVVLVSSDFIAGRAGDTHLSSDWQVATDSAFTQVVKSKMAGTAGERTSWTVDGLTRATRYYARIRHRANTQGLSEWSTFLTFQTRNAFVPEVWKSNVISTDLLAGDGFGTSVSIDDVGSRIAVGAPKDDTADGVDRGSIYVFKKTGENFSQEARWSSAKPVGDLVITVPNGGNIKIEADTSLVAPFITMTNATYTIPASATVLTITGVGGPGYQAVTAQQGLPEFPDGLPPYIAGQTYIAPTGDINYPDGLPVGHSLFPGGLPVYDPGQEYIASQGNVNHPDGLPRYVAAGTIDYHGPKATVMLNDTVYTFNGGYGLTPGVESTQSIYLNENHNFGYSVSMSGDSLVVAGGASTRNAKGKTVDMRIASGGQIRIQTNSSALTDRTFTADEVINLPADATSATLIGKGGVAEEGIDVASLNQNLTGTGSLTINKYVKLLRVRGKGGAGTPAGNHPGVNTTVSGINTREVPSGVTSVTLKGKGNPGFLSMTTAALNQNVSGSGSLTIAKNVTALTLTGKGADGSINTNAGQGLAAYPSGLPPYNAGQAYVAPTGNPSYPSGLPAYVARTGIASYPSGLPPYNPGQPYIEPTYTTSYEKVSHGRQIRGETDYMSWPRCPATEWHNGQFVHYDQSIGPTDIEIHDWQDGGQTPDFISWNCTITTQTLLSPGQPYIAPTGNPSYPSGLPPYNAGQGLAAYPSGLPPYNAGQPYIAPTGNASYPSGLPPYIAPSTTTTTGASTTMTINGQTYTFPGGNGGPASETTHSVTIPAGDTKTLTYNVASGGSGNVSHASFTTPASKGDDTTMRINNQTYTFPGGDGADIIPAVSARNESVSGTGTKTIARGVTSLTLRGRGAAGTDGAVTPALNQNVSGTGSLTIPAKITSVTARGKGGDGIAAVNIPALNQALSGSSSLTIPAGVTTLTLTGKGADGGTTTTMTINGQTYTFAGGNGGAATQRTETVSLPAAGNKTLSYSIAAGGSGNASHTSYTIPKTKGTDATVTINGQTYTFAGGDGIPANEITHTISLPGTSSQSLSYANMISGNISHASHTEPATTGAASTMTIDGNTYSFLGKSGSGTVTETEHTVTLSTASSHTLTHNIATGGTGTIIHAAYAESGGLAPMTTHTVSLPGTSAQTLEYNVTSEGYGHVEHLGAPYAATTGQSTTITVNGTPYVFQGGYGGVAAERTENVPLAGTTAANVTYSIASTGSGNVSHDALVIPVTRIDPRTSNFTTSGSTTVAQGVTEITLVGKGSDGIAPVTVPALNQALSGAGLLTIPKGIASITLVGKGAPSSSTTSVPAMDQDVSGTGNLTIAKGVTTVTMVGRGAPGQTTTNPEQGLAAYPSGLPPYNAGQAYVAPTGNPSYPSGLPPYNAGQGLAAYPSGLPPYNAGQAYIAPTGNASYPSGLPPYVPASTNITTGASSTMTLNGQTYTFPGGDGGAAPLTTHTATIPGSSALVLTYNIASGGTGNVKHAAVTMSATDVQLTGSGTRTIPNGVTSLSLTLKGNQGSVTTINTAPQPIYDWTLISAPDDLEELPGPPPDDFYEGDDEIVVWTEGTLWTCEATYPEGSFDWVLLSGSGGMAEDQPRFGGYPLEPDEKPNLTKPDELYIGGPYSQPSGAGYINHAISYWVAQLASPVNQTIELRGADTTVTINGQTYTAQGSLGNAAPATVSQTVTLSGTASVDMTYSVSSSGSLRLQHAAPTGDPIQGNATTMTVDGVLYTFPGGTNGAASNTTHNVPLDPSTTHTVNYTIANGGSGNASYASATIAGSNGTQASFTINGTTHTFPGGSNGPATNTTKTVTLTGTAPVPASYIVPAGANIQLTHGEYTMIAPEIPAMDRDISGTGTILIPKEVTVITVKGKGAPGTTASSPKTVTLKNGESGVIPAGVTSITVTSNGYGSKLILPTETVTFATGSAGAGTRTVTLSGATNIVYQPVLSPLGTMTISYSESVKTIGRASTFVINNQTYLFPGGDGGAAVQKTYTITLPGIFDMEGVYDIAPNGYGNVSHTAAQPGSSGGAASIAIVGGQTYLFPGGNGGPAVDTTHTVGFIPNTNAGSVSIARFEGNSWSQPALILPDVNTNELNFGFSIDLDRSGTRVIIGAPGHDTNKGAAYIYVYQNGSWILEQKIIPVSVSAGDKFGSCVSISKDSKTIAIGAADRDSARGVVSVYTLVNGAWVLQSTITNSDRQSGERFGTSISLTDDGNMMVVGAPHRTVSSKANAGALFVFRRSGSSWAQEFTITDASQQAGDKLGFTVSIDATGQAITASAPFHDVSGTADSGAIFTFAKYATNWQRENILSLAGRAANDQLGFSSELTSDSTFLVAGAPKFDHSGKTDSGIVVIYGQI